jgi:hypothetical protein
MSLCNIRGTHKNESTLSSGTHAHNKRSSSWSSSSSSCYFRSLVVSWTFVKRKQKTTELLLFFELHPYV